MQYVRGCSNRGDEARARRRLTWLAAGVDRSAAGYSACVAM
jgi:hypothetical protein